MKLIKNTLISSVFGLSFILFSFNARANEIVEVNIEENTAVVKMKVNFNSTNEIDFYLYNSNDRMIFSKSAALDETVESEVDFSGYKNGTYTLVSEVGNMRINKVLEVKDMKVELTDRYYTFKPVINLEGDLLTVYYKNSQGGDIIVSIEDNTYTFYDGFYKSEDRIFQRFYSLENLSAGEYTLNLSANGELFNYVVEID